MIKKNPDEQLNAKVISELLADPKFIKELARRDRNLALRVVDMLVDLFDKMFIRYSEQSGASADMRAAIDMLKSESRTIQIMYEDALKSTESVQTEKITSAGDGEVMKSKVITIEDVKRIQSIGRKSINELSKDELEFLESVAQKYYKEMGVKSPFFRRWFGDWRAEEKNPVTTVDISNKLFEFCSTTKELTKTLQNHLKNKSIYRGRVINNDTKLDIIIGAVGYNDTLTYAIRELHNKKINFDDVKQRVNLLGNIKEVIESAILLDSEIINDEGNPNRIMMHTFYSLTKYDGKTLVARVKVDEFKDDKNPTKRFYNLNDIEIPSAGIEGSTPLTDTDGIMSDSSDILTVSNLFNFVKTYDKDFKPKPCSLVLNEDGTPKVMYRGDAENFNVFDRKKSKYSNLYGRGFYFTESEEHAKQYGNIKAYYLDISLIST